LVEFYKRVEPPGWWKNTVKKAGIDINTPYKAFKEGAYLTVSTSLSVFLLLVGFGKLILPNPESSAIYTWVYLVLGFASVALWWRKIFSSDVSKVER